ncbi:MAG TPA: hypothetical protein VH083_28090 [Myxococcales bacterium]|jgi:hypothetical protein|nr:hypothetical protein [Myxococcales bacterium]
MQEALVPAVAAAQTQRAAMVNTFSPNALNEGASDREVFNGLAHGLQSSLVELVERSCNLIGLPRISLSMLAHSLGADDLLVLYRNTRKLAARLETEDATNRQLLKRSINCVKAYLSQLAPKPIYDRRGIGRSDRLASILSTRI